MSVSVSNALFTVVPQPFPMQENDAETYVGHPGCSSIAPSGHDLNQLRLSLSFECMEETILVPCYAAERLHETHTTHPDNRTDERLG